MLTTICETINNYLEELFGVSLAGADGESVLLGLLKSIVQILHFELMLLNSLFNLLSQTFLTIVFSSES